MMKQNLNPIILNLFNKDKPNQYEVKYDDRVEIICDSSSKGKFKIEHKKELLHQILNMKKELINVVNGTTIKERFLQIAPSTRRSFTTD